MSRHAGTLLDNLTSQMNAARPAAAAAIMATGGAGGSGTRGRRVAAAAGPAAEDEEFGLGQRLEFERLKQIQNNLLAKVAARKREEEKQAARRAEVALEVEEQQEEEMAAGRLAERMESLLEQQQLVNLAEYRESEPVLEALPPPQEGDQDDIDIEAEYLGALTTARAALGLDDALPDLAASKADRQELFRAGLRSSYVLTQALRRGAAGEPLVAALLSTMTQSPDSEAAGAAFVTLMALMGDEAASGQQPGAAAIAAVGQGAGAREEGEAAPGTTSLMLDAHFGLAAPVGDQAPPACSLDSVPTDAQLMQALRSNGYRTGHAAAGSGRSGRQQQGAALGQQQQQQEEAEEEGRVVRVQTIKLILRTAAAVCRYRWKHPAAAARTLSREGLAELLLASLHLMLDSAANQLQEDLNAAAEALLGAFDEPDWQRKLPALADRLAELGPSHVARLKLLRKLPTAHPRGLALQQLGAAVLLERLLPAGSSSKKGRAGGRSAIDRRNAAALDPAAVVAAQPWFSDARGLVNGATSGGQAAPRGGYHIGDVELLLKVSHLMLWPHMLKHAAGEPSCITKAFLAGWQAFLLSLQKHIKNLQAEDQAVRALASVYEVEYSNLVRDAGVPMSP